MIESKIKDTIRDVPDFPKEGILFKDITPLLQHTELNREITAELVNFWKSKNLSLVAGIESRGFIWGNALAQALGIPFVPIRKLGKLPADTYRYSYDLEYGSAEIEVHKDAIKEGDNVLIHDDLLATGGTAVAAAELVKMAGARVEGFSFIVELSFLEGKERLDSYSMATHSLAVY